MKIVGFETANSYIKVYDQDAENVLIYPNTTRQTRPAIDESVNFSTAPVYTIGGIHYLVGVNKDFATSSSKSAARYKSPGFYAETLIALSQSVEDGEEITASTGLPSNHFTREVIADLRELLVKRHTLEVNGKAFSFTIARLDVHLQPLGSFFASVYKVNGQPTSRHDELLAGKSLIIDIGFGSTDLADVVEGALDKQEEAGYAMIDAYADFYSRVKDAYPGTRLATSSISPLQFEIQTRGKDTISYGNDDYSVAEHRSAAFAAAARSIMSNVSAVRNLEEYDLVILTGGGVAALSGHLGSEVKEKNVHALKNPQEANVRGFVYRSKAMQQAKK